MKFLKTFGWFCFVLAFPFLGFSQGQDRNKEWTYTVFESEHRKMDVILQTRFQNVEIPEIGENVSGYVVDLFLKKQLKIGEGKFLKAEKITSEGNQGPIWIPVGGTFPGAFIFHTGNFVYEFSGFSIQEEKNSNRPQNVKLFLKGNFRQVPLSYEKVSPEDYLPLLEETKANPFEFLMNVTTRGENE